MVGNYIHRGPADSVTCYLPSLFRRVQCWQSGLPPVPCTTLYDSMLFPSVHLSLLWCTGAVTRPSRFVGQLSLLLGKRHSLGKAAARA